jgi:hypothetical protein
LGPRCSVCFSVRCFVGVVVLVVGWLCVCLVVGVRVVVVAVGVVVVVVVVVVVGGGVVLLVEALIATSALA